MIFLEVLIHVAQVQQLHMFGQDHLQVSTGGLTAACSRFDPGPQAIGERPSHAEL